MLRKTSNKQQENKKELLNKKRFRQKNSRNKENRGIKLSNLNEINQTSLKSKKKSNSLTGFEVCLTVYPTELEFKNPLDYIDNLWKENKENTGIIKIIPPSNWTKINNSI